jgi:hypothetical protein
LGATGTAQSNLALLAHNAIPTAHSINVSGAAGAIFNVNGFTQSRESLNGSGPTSLGAGGTLTLTDSHGTYPGAIKGSGTLIVAGGSWTMTGASTWNGALLHNAGVLALDGGSIAANVQSNAQFHFNGSVAGSVTVNTSIIHLGPTPTSGNFTQTGGVYNQIIAGVPSGQYSLLTVTGTVTLGGALDLDVVAGAPYPPGTTFTMIDNDGSDPVVGTFTRYPEGALVVSSIQRFTISYVGGTGNDVVLTGIPPRPATTTALTAAPNPSPFGERDAHTTALQSGSATLFAWRKNSRSLRAPGDVHHRDTARRSRKQREQRSCFGVRWRGPPLSYRGRMDRASEPPARVLRTCALGRRSDRLPVRSC